MTEEHERHSVLIVGTDGIPGGAAAAATRLEQKFRLPRQVAEKLVASIPAVVKKDVSMDDAQRYAAAIRSIGAEARIVPYSSNKNEKAGVTGILKPRRPRASRSKAKRGDVVRTSGGYLAVTKRREPAAAPARSDGTPAGGLVPAGSGASAVTDDLAHAHALPGSPAVESGSSSPVLASAPAPPQSSPSVQKTIMGAAFDPSAFALPSGLAPPPEAESVPDPFDDSTVESGTSEEGFIASMSGDFGVVPTDDLGDDDGRTRGSALSIGNDKGEGARPSLFDELMSLDDSGVGPGMQGGPEFGMSESGESKGRKVHSKPARRAPTSEASEKAPKAEKGLELSGPLDTLAFAGTAPDVRPPVDEAPDKADHFGNLELGGDPADSALQLDTDRPHLTGAFDAIDSGGFDVPEEDDDEFGLPAPPPRAKGTIRMSGLSDPLAAEIERTLSQSQPSERTQPVSGGPAIDVTGGFSAAAERTRHSNTKFVRVVGWMILLIIVAGGAVAGYVFYERWASTLDAKQFAEATNYVEHTIRLDAPEGGPASFVRGCAQPDPTVQTFSCRYSKEFYQFYFPEVAEELQNAASGSCYATLTEFGESGAEILDCTVSVSRSDGAASVRFYAASHRNCTTSLATLEAGDAAECTVRDYLGELALDAPVPNGAEAAVSFEFKRVYRLDTDVGDMDTREYLVTGAGRPGEYHHFAESIGLFVRRAELGGAAGLRLTFADRGGSTGGHQAWPR